MCLKRWRCRAPYRVRSTDIQHGQHMCCSSAFLHVFSRTGGYELLHSPLESGPPRSGSSDTSTRGCTVLYIQVEMSMWRGRGPRREGETGAAGEGGHGGAGALEQEQVLSWWCEIPIRYQPHPFGREAPRGPSSPSQADRVSETHVQWEMRRRGPFRDAYLYRMP